ncbi:MAG: hypothetical protein ACRD16_05340 [Thermoanaerobaculia bacterium]
MKTRIGRITLAITFFAAAATAQTTNPNPKNFALRVDGADASGIAGFAIDFERALDIAYSPRQITAPAPTPHLTLNLTPKGLAGLLDWLNEAGAGGSVTPRTVEILSLDNSGTVLIDWKLEGVSPIAITQLSSGTGNSPIAGVIFAFEKITLVKAKSD